jgi:hypothetical protein
MRLRRIGVAATAAVLAAGVAVAGAAPATIQSGAGPGWPKRLHPSDFVSRVDNPWFPLKTGSFWRYRGQKEGVPMTDIVRIAKGTKRILGVRTTVVHDTVLVGGRPEEETFDYYAQDRHGNVWYFGEDTKELNRQGKVVSREGSFRAGRDGARAGLFFPGHPKVGDSARQEFFKGHAEDHFRVIDRRATVSVPFVTTRHAVRTREWTPLEPGVVDNKYYVHGVGTVREFAVKGPVEKLRLVEFRRG